MKFGSCKRWLSDNRTSFRFKIGVRADKNTSQFCLQLLIQNKIQIRFNWIDQLDATIPQVHYLTFMYSSTCFGRPHAHHQELNNCSSSLWFYRWSVVVAVLLVVVGPVTTYKLRSGYNLQVYYLTFMYSSTCFGRPHAHHQELNNCSSSLCFYRWRVVVATTNSTATTTLQR